MPSGQAFVLLVHRKWGNATKNCLPLWAYVRLNDATIILLNEFVFQTDVRRAAMFIGRSVQ